MKKLLVLLMVVAFVSPAMAAEWNFYGSARMAYFYNDLDDDASGVTDAVTGDAEDDLDLAFGLQGNSRIGAKVKASDAVSGRFEYGSGPNLRLLYGTWNFGGGSLTVGQDYTPIDSLYSNQVIDDDIGLLKEGCVYEGRVPQLKLRFGGFQLAFLSPKTSTVGGFDTDVLLPKIEAAYDMKMDTFSVGGFGGYQTYTVAENTPEDENVVSYIIGGRAKANFGPAYVNAVLSYGQNLKEYGVLLRNDFAGGINYSLATGDTEDATTYAVALVVGAKVAPNFGLEAGVGYLKNEVDGVDGAGDREGDAMTYYIQAPITLAPGVFVVPEISVFDLGDNETDGATDVDNGMRIAYGAKFQINF